MKDCIPVIKFISETVKYTKTEMYTIIQITYLTKNIIYYYEIHKSSPMHLTTDNLFEKN